MTPDEVTTLKQQLHQTIETLPAERLFDARALLGALLHLHPCSSDGYLEQPVSTSTRILAHLRTIERGWFRVDLDMCFEAVSRLYGRIHRPIKAIFSHFGEIKNTRTHSSTAVYRPPSLIVWFREDVGSDSISYLQEMVGEFPGHFTWTLCYRKVYKCCTLCPSFVHDIAMKDGGFNLSQAESFIEINEPDLALRANLEFQELIEFLEIRSAEGSG
ncbi:MAG: hypothetical protein ACFB9N_01385 [Geitlerinemataceae cyanobacterium]